MDFIKVEQFQEQPAKIQKMFLDWWKPSEGDVYCNLYNNQQANFLIINKCQLEIFNTFKDDIKLYGIPLLSEGQLRNFIEENEHCLMDIKVENLNDNYQFYTVIGWEIKELEYGKEFGEILFEDYIEAEDLLQLYWRVACNLVKEHLKIN